MFLILAKSENLRPKKDMEIEDCKRLSGEETVGMSLGCMSLGRLTYNSSGFKLASPNTGCFLRKSHMEICMGLLVLLKKDGALDRALLQLKLLLV